MAGKFTTAGNTAVDSIAKWDGTSWKRVGSTAFLSVSALTVCDTGSGPALYAAARLGIGLPAHNVVRWTGATWVTLGNGSNIGTMTSLAAFDDGSGEALYAGGKFSVVGGVFTKNIARWNGSSWSRVGGAGIAGSRVSALTVFDDGSGPALYAGGVFNAAGGVPAGSVARWDGSSWSGLEFLDNVSALTVFDDGSGAALYAGGVFTAASGAKNVARWDGSSWAPLGNGVDGTVGALVGFDDGGGPKLYAGGSFISGSDSVVFNHAKFDGSDWEELGKIRNRKLDGNVYALTEFDDGSGPALYAGGAFTSVGEIAAYHVARWDGTNWTALYDGLNGDVHALAVFDDGSGPKLYAGGNFTTPGTRIARWNGTTWSGLGGGGMDGIVLDLVVFDDGNGPALYAAGGFRLASGLVVRKVARWNGSTWSALGSGIDGLLVNALAVFDDGNGPALYAGGHFVGAGGAPANRIAKWNGTSWSAIGDLNRSVLDLAVFDDGSGPQLYAGGHFTSIGALTARRIARWNGTAWSTLAGGTNARVYALHVLDNGDGSGPALYAAGNFTVVDGAAVNHIAGWQNSRWAPLGEGMSGRVETLSGFDDGGGAALFAGGRFSTTFETLDSHLAKWGCDTTPPTITCPPLQIVVDTGAPGEVVVLSVPVSDDHDLSPTVVYDPPSLSVFSQGTTLVTVTATDKAGNESVCSFPVIVVP